jgi:hypothetical protein
MWAMAKKSANGRNAAKQIVEESMPHLQVVEQPPAAQGAAADAARKGTKPAPSMAALKRKLGGAPQADATAAGAADALGAADDVEVFQVRNKQASADPADDPGPRTVIVSKKKGMQGGQG